MPVSADITWLFLNDRSYAQSGFSLKSGDFNTPLSDFADVAWKVWKDRLRSETSSDWTLQTVEARAGAARFDLSEPLQGGRGRQAILVSSSLLVSKIPIVGRQGRMYLPCVNDLEVTPEGNWVPSFQAKYQQKLNELMGDLDNEGFEMVMRRPNGDLDLVTQLAVRPYVGRQDRRLQRSRRS